MKESAYDNPVFFEKYSRMARSQLGLAGAGGWPALQPVLPPFEGRRVLGLDISERMLAVAGEKRGPRAHCLPPLRHRGRMLSCRQL